MTKEILFANQMLRSHKESNFSIKFKTELAASNSTNADAFDNAASQSINKIKTDRCQIGDFLLTLWYIMW